MRSQEPAQVPGGGTDPRVAAGSPGGLGEGAGDGPAGDADEPAAGLAAGLTSDSATGGAPGAAPWGSGAPGDADEGDPAAAEPATGDLTAGAAPSPWAGVELPPTATSRRRRKRGHRGGVGRRGGRRVAQPNPEDDPLYPFKVQAAKELGLWPKVEAEGWGALTSLESGRIGGYMQRLVKEAQEEGRIPPEVVQRLMQQRRIRPASTET
ncbi:hypothetical protein Tmar_0351 [Thermaerobacter marianensis DSM 12885]|uniref:Small acid-soluble spore protein alpha/beta type n=1 Tax=Thermaerobacter marianensis (strain ATCC 700841 / DSM 12885 / JCM 10246 / 7p75a) TaxID=644966 RepID=E6SG57_THEM7|nr:small, acid-soluble spore protein, alpha/beta type [Thermaerobacter marianensis]ADU50474.1 hypothetical protein Tmar_0351 [Thermaerobacter marianensis DSM 12885]